VVTVFYRAKPRLAVSPNERSHQVALLLVRALLGLASKLNGGDRYSVPVEGVGAGAF
jgi:hypothetical protein